MALAEDAPSSAASWRLATRALKRREDHLPAMCWEVWDALCDLQAGRHRYVWAGALELAERTGRSERGVYKARRRLEEAGIIRRVTTGGGRVLAPEKGSPGQASSFALGPAAEEALTRKKGERPFTLVGSARVNAGSPFNPERAFTPSSSPSGLPAPPSTPDVDEDGRPTSGRHADGLIRPRPERGGEPVRLSTLLAGPRPVPEAQGSIAAFLATPLSRPSPDLELGPPKRRRK